MSGSKKDNCCGLPLIAPSVLYPVGTSPPQILSHIRARQITLTQTQSRTATAAVHFIKSKEYTTEEPCASAGSRCLRNQTSRADEAWCGMPEADCYIYLKDVSITGVSSGICSLIPLLHSKPIST